MSRFAGAFERNAQDQDMEYIPLSTDVTIDPIDELAHSSWLGTSQTQDAQATVKALASQLWDWIIVDHYALMNAGKGLSVRIAKS